MPSIAYSQDPVTVAVSIKPGHEWKDTEGNIVQAHGGGMLLYQDEYFWYGEHRQQGSLATGVSVYRFLKDQGTLKYEGLALRRGSHPDIDPCRVLERPKVLHNPETGNFVMWMHIDGGTSDYTWARLGVAVSNKGPLGPFEFKRSFRPHEEESRDFTVWKDEDTHMGYLAYSSENNQTMHICALTSDYMDVESHYSRTFVGQAREAPAFFKYKDVFMMATSGCTGWEPNKLEVFWTRDPTGQWASLGNPCSGRPYQDKETTFSAQPCFVTAVPEHAGVFIFMADRWNKDNLPASRYIWLPLIVKDNTAGVVDWKQAPVALELCWQDSWSWRHLALYATPPDAADVDTPLIRAAHEGQLKIVITLLAEGVDAGLKGRRGWTALMHAASRGNLAIARVLVVRNADVDARCKEGGSTAMMHAAWNGHTDMVKYLLSAGGDVAARDNQGRTALMTAAARGHIAVVRVLLGANAGTDARDTKGDTALLCARQHEHVEVVELLSAGAI